MAPPRAGPQNRGMRQLAKITLADRRRRKRRDALADEMLPTHQAFDGAERGVFRLMERRRLIRRAADARLAISRLER